MKLRFFVIFIVCALWTIILSADETDKSVFKSETKCWAKASELIDAGNYDDALNMLTIAVQKFSKSEIILSLYGEVLYKKHDLKKAEAQFRKVLDMNPYNNQAKQRIEDIRKTEI